ncbi:hypothetical protein [Rhabdochromatium marinum]|uniref:hypothetical protein n=1 Tax=Rhabdochromatium marinum TaxID=48729 RepID=UPI0019049913|nr:hypothetical protein [Rhabdochromatium marinum]MBK1649665.1 hypothetical protein [Rhabdochromatium marinum]
MINCNSMRAAILLSGGLLLAGLFLGGIAITTPLHVPTSYVSLILVLTSGAMLAATFVVAILPGVAQRLDECQH